VGFRADWRLTFRHLSSFKVVLAASPHYLNVFGMPRTTSNLKTHKCIQHRFPNTGKLQEWPLSFTEVNLPTTMISNDTETRVYFATHGHEIAYLPDFLVQDEMKSGALVRVLEKTDHWVGFSWNHPFYTGSADDYLGTDLRPNACKTTSGVKMPGHRT